MKTLKIIAICTIGTLLGCSKNGTTIVKPTNITGATYVADNVTIYSGVVTSGTRTDADGSLAQARYAYPNGITQDQNGNIYVSEYVSGEVRKITPDGTVSTYATGFTHPGYLATSGDGTLYVPTDYYLMKVAPNGGLISKINDGYFTSVVNDNGTMYASLEHMILKQDASGSFALYAGNGETASTDAKDGTTASFEHILSMAADKNGNLIVMDSNNIRIVNTVTSEVTTLPLKTADPFGTPQGVAVDQWDNIYVVNGGTFVGNQFTSNGYILKITPDGTVSNFAGNKTLLGGTTASVQGPAQSAAFDAPNGIVLLSSGYFLVTSIDDIILQISTHQQQ